MLNGGIVTAVACDDTVEVLTKCPFCGETHVVKITIDQWNRFHAEGVMGILDVEADIREMLKTGICSKCW